MAEKSPNLTKDINLQIQESERTTNKASQKYTCISIPKHITIKLLKTKDKKKKNLDTVQRKMALPIGEK